MSWWTGSAASGEKPPPMSVYRALDFLVAEGLAHRIESRNAYLACGRAHGSEDVIVFLICERCGKAAEVASHAVGRDLAWATRAAGFTPRTPVIEIAGTCSRCQSGAVTRSFARCRLTARLATPTPSAPHCEMPA